MMIRDLLLPNGTALQFGTDKIIPASEANYPFQWGGSADSLSGAGIVNVWTGTRQPFVGCETGGDKVAHRLMMQLAREYIPKRQEGDDDARWAGLGC